MSTEQKRPAETPKASHMAASVPIASVQPERTRPRMDPEADAACVLAVLAGKPERFGELIERYQAAVFAVVRARVHDVHSAEDVAQEVFINAFTALKSLRQPGFFYPWLMQIARHSSGRAGQKDQKRSTQRQQQLTGDEMQAPVEEPVHERLSHVLSKVEELPEPYRQTVILKYQYDLSCKEIAEKEGVAVGTITSRLTRALVVLRNSLQENI